MPMANLLVFANLLCALLVPALARADRENSQGCKIPKDDVLPLYHITPPGGWMNDPNGLMDYKGIYHVFFQYNPVAPKWSHPYWGHVVSKDLVHWQRLPVAIIPDTPYDFDGVFSGSATVVPGKGPVILYTGVSNLTELDYFHQVQAMAEPADPNDPMLVRWVKPAHNPIISEPPPKGVNKQFRDPQTAWKQDVGDGRGKVWLTAIGSQVSCVGSAPIYASKDFQNWEFFGFLHSQVGVEPFPEGTECKQYGEVGRMWEVVCVFRLNVEGKDVHVFKFSDQQNGRVPYGRDWYVLSDLPLNFTKNAVVGQGNAFTPEFDGKEFDPRVIDYGDIYASKFFMTSGGRTLWMAWSFETSTGCKTSCGDGSRLTDERGWQGVQTLFREVNIDLETGDLLMLPVKEVEKLHISPKLYSDDSLDVASGVTADLPLKFPSSSCTRGRQMDVDVKFRLKAKRRVESIPFKVGVSLVTGDDFKTSVFLNGTLTTKKLKPSVEQLEVWLDRSETGGDTDTRLQGGKVRLVKNANTNELTLRLLVDHSILEAFGQGGRVRMASRIYPDDKGDWGLQIFNIGGLSDHSVTVAAEVDVWEMGEAIVSEI